MLLLLAFPAPVLTMFPVPVLMFLFPAPTLTMLLLLPVLSILPPPFIPWLPPLICIPLPPPMFSGELKHPIASDTTVGRRILLFAEEWPNQLSLYGNILRLCTSVLIKALSPEDEISNTEFWHSMYHLLNMFPAVESPRANKNIAIMVKDYAFKYAKEHPYLLALNIGLTVVGFSVPPFLGVLGFTRAGVGAGSTAAAWQSSLRAVPKGSLLSICQSIGATGSAPMITAAANVSRWALGGFAALQEMLGRREGGRDEDEPEPDRG
ncbi:hypothetical protein B9Z19DRAFT_611824 [Tuber borchii]|uniref:Uncharacterized protein n=1 Tax=Tuber borchii TaxID=42251 RepID=A0A2T6ZBL8_TUBBO|nr:hypothetical protein B9Z19DRAFT_611824 [Tuber borchii]